MRIYTLTGDDGTTSLSGGRRVPKHCSRVEAYGTVDELIAWIGLLRDLKENDQRKDFLIFIQDQLMRCAVALASEGQPKMIFSDNGSIQAVEEAIDRMEESLKPLKNFILPGGNTAVSYCHIARCVCRRAERAVLRLRETETTPEIIHKFLNRLSDYLFILSRIIALDLDIQEIKWPVDKPE